MIKKILDLIKKYEEIVLYLIAGVLTTVVSLGSYYLFNKIGIDFVTNSIISWIIAVVFAYVINKLFVFKTTTTNNILSEVISFFSLRIVSLLIDIAVMYLLFKIFKMDEMLSKLIVQVIVTVLNYIFSKLFVFKENN